MFVGVGASASVTCSSRRKRTPGDRLRRRDRCRGRHRGAGRRRRRRRARADAEPDAVELDGFDTKGRRHRDRGDEPVRHPGPGAARVRRFDRDTLVVVKPDLAVQNLRAHAGKLIAPDEPNLYIIAGDAGFTVRPGQRDDEGGAPPTGAVDGQADHDGGARRGHRPGHGGAQARRLGEGSGSPPTTRRPRAGRRRDADADRVHKVTIIRAGRRAGPPPAPARGEFLVTWAHDEAAMPLGGGPPRSSSTSRSTVPPTTSRRPPTSSAA